MAFPRIAFLGGGNMAQAMIAGLVAKGVNPTTIGVCERDDKKREQIHDLWGVEVFPAINEDLAHYAVWMLAVKPQDMPSLCQGLQPLWQHQAMLGRSPLIISIAAGIGLTSLMSWVDGQGENQRARIVRVMPNTPASVGKAMSGAVTNPHCTQEDIQHAHVLLTAIGEVEWVKDELMLHAITAISGSGTAYYFYFTECLANAAMSLGISPDIAQKLARQTLIGAGHLAEQSQEPISILRERVTSKGGTTEQALNVFAKSLPNIVNNATIAAQNRSIVMGS